MDYRNILTFRASGLISRSAGGTTTYYVYDPNGNVCFRTQGSIGGGGGTFSYTALPDYYDAYGNTYYSHLYSDPWGLRRSAGLLHRPSDGAGALRSPLLRPGHGRWITRDPASYLGGSNLYGYSLGDPVDLTDPSGWISTRSTHKYPEIHIPWKTVGGIALGLAVACIPGGARSSSPGRRQRQWVPQERLARRRGKREKGWRRLTRRERLRKAHASLRERPSGWRTGQNSPLRTCRLATSWRAAILRPGRCPPNRSFAQSSSTRTLSCR